MKRFSLFTFAALSLLSTITIAQPPGGGGGRGRGGMGGGFGNGPTAFLMMLNDPAVRKEVKVSDESFEAMQKAQGENGNVFTNFREMSEEERAKAIKEMNTKAQDLLDEVVDPAGMKRLMGLLIQQRGKSSVTNELIAKEISLSEDSIKKINEELGAIREKMFAQFRPGGAPGGAPGGGGPGAFDPAKMREAMQEMQKTTDEAVDKLLTDDQKKAVEALKGEKFTFTEGGGFNFGGRGGPGGGAPGGRPRGNRPGSENNSNN